MRFTKIIGENFQTFPSIEYVFEKTPIRLQGINKTDDNQENNGSGKSGLLAILEFAVAGTNSRGVKDKELITYGKDKLRAETFLYCPIRNKTLHIVRIAKQKSSSELFLDIDNVEVEFATVRDGNNMIFLWMGMTKDDFMKYYIINKFRFKSIFHSSNRDNVDLINRFSDASIIDGLENIVKADVVLLEKELKSLEEIKFKLIGKKEGTEEEIEKEKTFDFEADKEERIEEIEERNEEIEERNEEIREDIATCTIDCSDLIKKIGCIEKEVKKISPVLEEKVDDFADETKKCEDKIALIDLEIRAIRKDISDDNVLIQDVSEMKADSIKNIVGSVECPKCSHEFVVGKENVNVGDEKDAIKEADENLFFVKECVCDKKKNIQVKINNRFKYENALIVWVQKRDLAALKQTEAAKKIRILKNDVFRHNNSLIDKKDIISNSKRQIELSEFKIKNNGILISEIKKEVPNTLKIDSLKKKLKEYNTSILVAQKNLDSKDDKISETKEWITNFQRFGMDLANMSLKVIQKNCNDFLEAMGSDMKVILEGFRIKSDGKLKEEITAYVYRDEKRSFGSFSTGEQGRVQFAMILAIQYMINLTNKYGGLDFLSVDEVFEGLDGLGLRSIMKSIKDFEKTIIIVTHIADHSASDNTVTVEKINGISNIKKD